MHIGRYSEQRAASREQKKLALINNYFPVLQNEDMAPGPGLDIIQNETLIHTDEKQRIAECADDKFCVWYKATGQLLSIVAKMYIGQPSIPTFSASNQNMMHLLRESMQHQAVLYCHTTAALTADMNISQGNVSSGNIVHNFLSKWKGNCMLPASCIGGQCPSMCIVDGQNLFCP